jgi:uncharacterized damage-inducible protein DinB
MTKWNVVAGLVLAAGLAVLPVLAQDAAKKMEPPKPPVSPSQAVLDTWNDIGRKLTAMAEDFPEDKYEFKPKPEQRSFREQLLHAADTNYFFTNVVLGQKPPAQEDFSKDKLKTKAEVAAYVKKSFADGAAAIKAKGDAGMNSLIVDPFENQKARVIDMAYGFAEHSGEHYGQLVVYYRLSGLVPPESRPKTRK